MPYYDKKPPQRQLITWLAQQFSACLFLCFCSVQVAPHAVASSQPSGKWQSAPASSGDTSLSLTLKAEKEVKGWMKSATPTLTVQCSKKKPAIYVETWLPLEITQVDKQIVRVQFDNGKPTPQRWQEITNAAMGASVQDSLMLLKQFTRSKKFVFEFPPFNSPPAQAEFDLAGLDAYLPQLARLCWE